MATRRAYLAALVVVVPLGFATKLYSGPGAHWVSGYAGGILYVLFWILLALAVAPGAPLARVVLGVLLLTTLLEFLQLWHPPLLQRLRGTFLGRALIGDTFSWWDIPHYVVGALLGAAYAHRIRSPAGGARAYHGPRMLSHQEARQTYDRIGSFQDSQAFYEDRATGLLLRHGDFGSAGAVFEFGCGTGRFAQRLLEQLLPPAATYRGVDLSPKMVGLARQRLAAWAPRAEVLLSEGEPPSGEPSGSCDRFVSNYVFDLLSEADIRAVLREAHRMLRPGGLLCLAGLSTGVGPVSRAVAGVWSFVQARRPSLVGGCRPVDLLPLLSPADWRVRHHSKVTPFGVASEVLVAERLQPGSSGPAARGGAA